MNRRWLAAAAAAAVFAVGGCASGAAPTTASLNSEAEAADGGERVICRKEQSTGSHLGGRRVCKTMSEWREADRDVQAYVNTIREAPGLEEARP